MCSIAVVGNVGGLSVTSGTTGILSNGGLAVGNDTGVESFHGSGDVLSLATPRLQGGGLQGAAVGEREGPGSCDGGDFVHLVKIQGGFLLGLPSREEHHCSHGGWDSPGESAHGEPCDLLLGGLLGAVGTLGHHVGLKETSLEENVVLEE